ncbi:MAG: hypothetical protein R3B53_04425 [Candidatus Paceibacterota bacterium]
MEKNELQKDISKIIYDGIQAPSGENSQPWQFIVDKNVIHVLNIENRDSTLYNSGQHGSFVAHGALIENMVISASHYGYRVEITTFPSGDSGVIAKLVLHEEPIAEDPLYASIHHRQTNRHKYNKIPISKANQALLVDACAEFEGNVFKIVDDPDKLDILANASATVERLMFRNKAFHRFFFKHFFEKQYDEHEPSGLYIDTLGMSAFEKFGIKLIKNWPIAYLFNLLGIARINSRMRAQHYRQSAAFGVVVTYGDQPHDYLEAGRAMERVWLKSTELGISLQPCVGVLYLWEGLMKNAESVFSESDKNLVETARNQILEVFEVQGKTIPMFFRMGYNNEKSRRAFRYEPRIDYIS